MALPTAVPSLLVISKVTAPGSVSGRLTATDPENQALSFALLSGGAPQHGSVTINPDGTFSYTPAAGYLGTDTFYFTVKDAEGGVARSYVSVQVTELAPATVSGSDTLTLSGIVTGVVADGGIGSDTLAFQGSDQFNDVVLVQANEAYINDVALGSNLERFEIHGGGGNDTRADDDDIDTVLYG